MMVLLQVFFALGKVLLSWVNTLVRQIIVRRKFGADISELNPSASIIGKQSVSLPAWVAFDSA